MGDQPIITSLRPTPTRLALLQAVADDEVTRVRNWATGKIHAQHRSAEGLVRDVTRCVKDMEAAGWIHEGPADPASGYTRRPMRIGNVGRMVLDAATRKD